MPQPKPFPNAPASVAGLLISTLIFSAPALAASGDDAPATGKKSRLVDLWQPGDPGERMNIRGRVTSLDGTPLAGISVDIRQPDGDGNWTERYSTTLTTDSEGRFQFGSVVPESNFCGEPHVEVVVYQNGWEYFDDKMVFSDESSMDSLYYGDGTMVFLEESEVKGKAVKYGRFDIVLTPE